MKNVKQFLLKILSSDDPTSSKRLAGLIALLLSIIASVVAMVKNHGIMPDVFFNGLLLFAAGAFAINGVENIFKRNEVKVIPEVTDKIDNPDA